MLENLGLEFYGGKGVRKEVFLGGVTCLPEALHSGEVSLGEVVVVTDEIVPCVNKQVPIPREERRGNQPFLRGFTDRRLLSPNYPTLTQAKVADQGHTGEGVKGVEQVAFQREGHQMSEVDMSNVLHYSGVFVVVYVS